MEPEFESLNQDGQLNINNGLVSEASNVAAPQYATDFTPQQSQQLHCQYQGQEKHSSNHNYLQPRSSYQDEPQAFDEHLNNSQDVQQKFQSSFDNSITDNTAQQSSTSERIQRRQYLKREQRRRHLDRMSECFEELRLLLTSEQKSRQQILELAISKIKFLSR